MPFLLTRRSFTLALASSSAAVAAPRAKSHWAFLSDTHIPADPTNIYRGSRPYENMQKVAPELVAGKYEGTLICGDIARLEGKLGDYQSAKTLLTPVLDAMPLAGVMGNHDDRKVFQSVFAQDPARVQRVPNKHVLAIDLPSVRLLILDSLLQTNQTPGLLGKAQRTWLDQHLRESSDLPTLLFFHHTLDDNDGSLLDAPRLFDLVKPHRKVKALVFGHSHRYSYDTLDGIHLINLPALGYNFNDSEPIGWVDAKLAGEGGEFTLHAVAGNQSQNGKSRSLAWRA